MGAEILVVLKKRDDLEQTICCLETVVRPGMRVVFLIPYRQQGFSWLQTELTAMQTEIKSIAAIKKSAAVSAFEIISGSAQEKVVALSANLQRKGVTVGVRLYAGSIRTAVTQWRGTATELIVLPVARNNVFQKIRSYIGTSLDKLGLTVHDPRVVFLRHDG